MRPFVSEVHIWLIYCRLILQIVFKYGTSLCFIIHLPRIAQFVDRDIISSVDPTLLAAHGCYNYRGRSTTLAISF